MAGNTVITPNKIITDGEWRGVLYVSLKPDFTALYAIGEQPASPVGGVQNGGWTVSKYTLSEWKDENNQTMYAYDFVNGPQQFIYKDNPDKNILCSIKVDTYNKIVGGNIYPGWSLDKYGKPCMDDNENGPYQFGTHDHRFVVATDGAYFKSVLDNYDYWIRNATLVNLFQQKLPNQIVNISKIAPYFGTYVFAVGGLNETKINDLAIFDPKDSQVFALGKDFAKKYVSSQLITGEYAPALLGHPVGEKNSAAFSMAGTKGEFQNFLNGQMYLRDGFWSNSTYIVFGKIVVYYNGPNAMRNGQVGSGGVFGFPIGDPFYPYDNDKIIRQKFEKDSIQEDQNNQIVSSLANFTEDRRKLNKEFAERILHESVEPGKLTDVEAFAKIADQVAEVTHDNDEFVKDMTFLFIGLEKVGPINIFFRKEPDTSFSDTGFLFIYNDSHFCQQSNGLSNQLYHALPGFNIGYFTNLNTVKLADHLHEQLLKARLLRSQFGTGGSSFEDSRLTIDMGRLGVDLRDGKESRNSIGQAIIKIFADLNYVNLRKTRAKLEEECNIRRNFRIFEKQKFGDPYFFYPPSLHYPEDMKLENGRWNQYYEKFGSYLNAKAEWDSNNGIVVLYDSKGKLIESFKP